ncbi:MAG TPA: hypothetical protein VFP95_07210 [Gammaproteobacteria bacterium]|nr:hypothetical protein [Gammaproteobacteria bacterium]
MFGSTWVKQYGDTANDTWAAAIDRLDDGQIINGLARILDESWKFPPNLSEFVELCRKKRLSASHKIQRPGLPEPDSVKEKRLKLGRKHIDAMRAKHRFLRA